VHNLLIRTDLLLSNNFDFIVSLIVRLTSRICAHNLEIEKGRYFQINRTERFCKIYKDLEIEDENHFLWAQMQLQ
jgi:hypothetical protein